MDLGALLLLLVVAVLSTIFGCADGVASPICDFLGGVVPPVAN